MKTSLHPLRRAAEPVAMALAALALLAGTAQAATVDCFETCMEYVGEWIWYEGDPYLYGNCGEGYEGGEHVTYCVYYSVE